MISACLLHPRLRTYGCDAANGRKGRVARRNLTPGAPRSVREPLDSHGSRCSAVSMAQLPMSEERRICAAKPIKPVACSFGFETQPFEFAARPADDIEVNPLQGRTQLRSVEVAVVVDPASNARVVHLGQIWQGFVAAMMKRPAPDRSANERQRLRAGGGLEAVREDALRAFPPHRLPGPKLESQKVERDDREVAASVRILTMCRSARPISLRASANASKRCPVPDRSGDAYCAALVTRPSSA